jgi:hypothetical protein
MIGKRDLCAKPHFNWMRPQNVRLALDLRGCILFRPSSSLFTIFYFFHLDLCMQHSYNGGGVDANERTPTYLTKNL